jgi:hypothetical protein
MNKPHDNRECDGSTCDNTFFVNGVLTHPTIPGTQERERQLFCSEGCKDKAELKLFLDTPFAVQHQSKVTRLGHPTHSGVVRAQKPRIRLSIVP